MRGIDNRLVGIVVTAGVLSLIVGAAAKPGAPRRRQGPPSPSVSAETAGAGAPATGHLAARGGGHDWWDPCHGEADWWPS